MRKLQTLANHLRKMRQELVLPASDRDNHLGNTSMEALNNIPPHVLNLIHSRIFERPKLALHILRKIIKPVLNILPGLTPNILNMVPHAAKRLGHILPITGNNIH